MSFQAIRGTYEKVVIAAMGAVPTYVQNQSLVDVEAKSEYCFVRVNFGLIDELTVGCAPNEFIRGSLVCEVYTRKNEGPARGIELITPVIRDLCALNRAKAADGQQVVARVGRITGPSQTALEGQPHHLTRFSVPIHARYDGP